MTESFFTLACILGFGSWFIAIIEMIATHSFLRLAFNIGIPIIKRTIEISTNDFTPRIDITLKESEGKFRFTADRKVLFLSQIFWFKFFRINTPFPLKAVGTINENNTIDLVVRLPIGTSLFLLFWLIGWTVGSLGAGLQSGEIGMIGFGLIGWIFAAIMIGISYPIEKNRLEIMIEELKKIIAVYNTRYS
jgi:hypothetical protein